MKINQQWIVVTGAASGMGLATVRHFSNQGAKVLAIDKHPGITEVAASLGGRGLCLDITQESAADQIDTALAAIDPPRVLVNCAGIAPAKRMVGREGPAPLSHFESVIQVNLLGTINLVRLVTARMIASAEKDPKKTIGVIINTASVAAFEGQIGQVAYSASKGGIVSMTLPLAREFAQFGIRVNTIAPGLIETPLLTGMPEDVQSALGASVPFPKRLGKPEEFAQLAFHLVENEMINGAVIRLDGALRMQAK